MEGSDANKGVAMRALRTTVKANGAPLDGEPQRGGARSSLGRLLRLVADPRSDETHMEAAILHHTTRETVKTARVLSLSDHRHISNLSCVVDAVDRAIRVADDDVAPASDRTAARNLLRALARALATQSVSECVSTKRNLCIWTPQSKKRLVLLEWMLCHSSGSFRAVVHDALGGVLREDKTSQLTACLVIFELAQRCRRGSRDWNVSNGDWSELLDALVVAVQSGTVQTVTGTKASKLGVAALDALFAVLCLAAGSTIQRVVASMQFALSTFTQWNALSVRRTWLVMAARQLNSLVAMHDIDCSSDVVEMIKWHWNATALWLCVRSDCVLAVKKRVVDVAAQVTNELYELVCVDSKIVNIRRVQHTAVARLRQLCVLLGSGAESPADILHTSAVRGKLLIALSVLCSAPTTKAISVEVLQRLLLGRSNGGETENQAALLLSRVEVEAFVSMIQRHTSSLSELGDETATLIAELCLRAGVPIHDKYCSEDIATTVFWLMITNHALDSYKSTPTFDEAMQTLWLRETTKAVLQSLEDHSDKRIRLLAGSMITKLDLVYCLQFIVSAWLSRFDSATTGHLVAMIFQRGSGSQALTKELASTLVDTLCHGAPTQSPVTNPGHFEIPSGRNSHNDHAQASILSRSREGWCIKISQDARIAILMVFVEKIVGSPRNSVLVTWLREVSLLGWFDEGLAEVLPIVTTHIKNLEKLSDDLLEDSSSHSSRAVEHLLFARLAPNLVLRLIPRSAFTTLHNKTPNNLWGGIRDAHNPGLGCLSDLAQELWKQLLDPLEFKEVKMLSVELLTKLPADQLLPRVLDQLVGFLAEQEMPTALAKSLAVEGIPLNGGGFVTAKLLVYYLNLIFTDESASVMNSGLLAKAMCVLLTVLAIPCAPSEAFSAEKSPLVDLQMGTIECLSLLFINSINSADNPHNKVEVAAVEDVLVELIVHGVSPRSAQSVSPFCDDEFGRQSLFQNWRRTASDNAGSNQFSETQLRVCCCNVMLSALAKLDSGGVLNFQDRVLRAKLLPSMQHLPPSVFAGCLQIIFSFIFKAGPSLAMDDRSSMEVVNGSIGAVLQILKDIENVDDLVCMNALKLLGALIGKVTWFWHNISSSGDSQQSIATGLRNLRDSTPLKPSPVRQLAQSLLQAIASG